MPRATNLARGRAACMLAAVTDGDGKGVPSRATGCAVEAWPSHCGDGVKVWVALLSSGLLFVDPRHVLAHSMHFKKLTPKLAVPTRQGLAQPERLPQAPRKSPLSFCMWQDTF